MLIFVNSNLKIHDIGILIPKVDEFELEAVTLTKINKIRIGHNGKRPGAGWYLDKVVVRQQGDQKYNTIFECNR